MKKRIVLFLLVCGLVFGLGSVPNANAYTTTYFDLGFPSTTNWTSTGDWDGDLDGNALTGLFNEIVYTAETSSYQYDDNGTVGVQAGDSFQDLGNVIFTGFELNNTPVNDTEGLNAMNDPYEMTLFWDDLTGVIDDVQSGATGGGHTLITSYTGGTIEFYIDDSPDAAFTTPGQYASDNNSALFKDGENFANVNVTSGIGSVTFDALGNALTGSYTIYGTYSSMSSGLWFDSAGIDLSTFVISSGWVIDAETGGYTAPNMETDHSGGIYNGKTYVYEVGSSHQSSLYATVPEPATMLLLGSGLIGLAGFGRKKKFFKKD